MTRGTSRYVFEAMERRRKEGLCPICGGKMVKPKLTLLKDDAPLMCINSDDGRHGRPRRTVRSL